MKHGLVLGKFYPPHAGHHLLVRTAAAACERVTVLVLAASVESIPLEVRVGWMKELHRDLPNVKIVGGLDDHPVDYHSDEVWKTPSRCSSSCSTHPSTPSSPPSRTARSSAGG